MKKKLFILVIISIILLSVLLSNRQVWQIIKNQLASVMSINVQLAYNYQKSGGLNRNLKIGDSGSDVKIIQQTISELDKNFSKDNITGYLGPITSGAILNFQKNNNLDPTGIVDYNTLNFFNNFYLNELCPQKYSGPVLFNDILFLVNKENPLPLNYVPLNLEKIPESIRTIGLICLKSEVIPHL